MVCFLSVLEFSIPYFHQLIRMIRPESVVDWKGNEDPN
jgi:hypothetical protein